MNFAWVGEEKDGYRKFRISDGDFNTEKYVRVSNVEILVNGSSKINPYHISSAVKEAIRDIAYERTGIPAAYDDQLGSVIDQVPK
jgi:hypothetical protein